MILNTRSIYAQMLANEFRNNFEEKTGITIGTGKYFDMSKIIKFHGGLIEFADIYDDENKLEAYICKIDNDKNYNFKFVIDKNKSEKLKEIDEVGQICYGKWNLFLMTLFYMVIDVVDKLESFKDGDILYPNSDIVNKVKVLKK